VDNLPFDVLPERVGVAEMSKYFDYRIEILRRLVEKRPVSDVVYDGHQWQMKFMSFYGKILGALEFAVEFKHMPSEMSKHIEDRIKNMIQYHMSVLIMGQE